jgi:hypothetical protein
MKFTFRDWIAYQAWPAGGNAPFAGACHAVPSDHRQRRCRRSGFFDPGTVAAASMFQIDDPLVAGVAAAIGKTPDGVVAVFQLAETYV